MAWIALMTGNALADVSQALTSGDSSLATGNEIRAEIANTFSAIPASRQGVWDAVFKKNSGVYDITGVSWNPTHDAAQIVIGETERNVPLLVSNGTYSSTGSFTASSTDTKTLAVAGEFPAVGANNPGRYLVFGGNPLHDLTCTTSTTHVDTCGWGDAELDSFLKSAIAWATRGADAGASFKVVVAHQPESSPYFNQELTTLKWVQDAYANETLNAEDACDNANLSTCLSGAQLLVIGRQMAKTDDSDNPAASTDAAAVTAAVKAFLDGGGAVLYVQYDGSTNALRDGLWGLFGLSGADLGGTPHAGLSEFAPSTLDPLVGLTELKTAFETVRDGTLLKSDYQTCLNNNQSNGFANTAWIDCADANFKTKLRDGLFSLRASLNALDQQGSALFDLVGYKLLKLFVLLGDKYRIGDATTTAISYPVGDATSTDAAVPPKIANAAFADSSILYVRANNPRQADLGTLYCPRAFLLAGTCAANGYDYDSYKASVPLYNNQNFSQTLFTGTEWTVTGYYALPGTPITVTRTDNINTSVKLHFFFQRDHVTRSLSTGGGANAYDRPQWPKSPAITLNPGQTLTLSSPVGGPIYLLHTGSPTLAGQSISVTFSNVAKHPAILDTGDPTQISAFLADQSTNPLPYYDIQGEGFATHIRADKLKDALDANGFDLENKRGVQPININYGGDLAKFIADYRLRFIANEYNLAGFKEPGEALDSTLSSPVKGFCNRNGWNCTDEALHTRKSIQHTNYDESSECGSACSGNPWDSGQIVRPMGWGEGHELGHNFQRGALNINWVALGSQDNWNNYSNRSGEVSNNLFPYNNIWNYFRNHQGDRREVLETHLNHKNVFSILQSAKAGLVKNGQLAVYKDASCTLAQYAANTADAAYQTIWSATGAYDNNGERVTFYVQLPILLDGATLADGTVLNDGWEIFTLLYAQERLFAKYGANDADWLANRDKLGFGLFPRTGGSVYGGKNVTQMPGNDYLLVALSYITGRDFRPYFDMWQIRYSSLASQQVQAHRDSGRVKTDMQQIMAVLDQDMPLEDLSAVPMVAIDGTSWWPRDGFHPAQCQDTDSDGVNDKLDAFPNNAGEQYDTDGDGTGNNADTDDDNDGILDTAETAQGTNPLQADSDGDGVADGTDNCFLAANAHQTNSDGAADGGDACDADDDNDGITDADEASRGTSATSSDTDNDGVADNADNCPTVANADQASTQRSGVGDACLSKVASDLARASLLDAINGAQSRHDTGDRTLGDGSWLASDFTVLLAAINDAQAVYNYAQATQKQVVDARDALVAKVDDFMGQRISFSADLSVLYAGLPAAGGNLKKSDGTNVSGGGNATTVQANKRRALPVFLHPNKSNNPWMVIGRYGEGRVAYISSTSDNFGFYDLAYDASNSTDDRVDLLRNLLRWLTAKQSGASAWKINGGANNLVWLDWGSKAFNQYGRVTPPADWGITRVNKTLDEALADPTYTTGGKLDPAKLPVVFASKEMSASNASALADYVNQGGAVFFHYIAQGSANEANTNTFLANAGMQILAGGASHAPKTATLDALLAKQTLTDTDGDTVPDEWEDINQNGTVDAGETDKTIPDSDDNGTSDANEDPDGDGVGTKAEITAGTYPYPLAGLGNPPSDRPLDPRADDDGDGLSNYAESTLGTDPAVPNAVPAGVSEVTQGQDDLNRAVRWLLSNDARIAQTVTPDGTPLTDSSVADWWLPYGVVTAAYSASDITAQLDVDFVASRGQLGGMLLQKTDGSWVTIAATPQAMAEPDKWRLRFTVADGSDYDRDAAPGQVAWRGGPYLKVGVSLEPGQPIVPPGMSKRVTLNNLGDLNLDLGTASVTAGVGFSLSDDTCSDQRIAPGASCGVTVALANTADGPAAHATLSLPSDHPYQTSDPFAAWLRGGENAGEEARRRLPPVVQSVQWLDAGTKQQTLMPGQSYTLSVDVLGYDDAFTVIGAVFACAVEVGGNIDDDACATSSGDAVALLYPSAPSSGTGSYSYEGVTSKTHRYDFAYTVPSDWDAGNDLIARLYYKSKDDTAAARRSISLLIPGGQGYDAVGRGGRKLRIAVQ